MGSKHGKWSGQDVQDWLAHLSMKSLYCSGGKAAYGNISYWDRMILYCNMNICKIQFSPLSSTYNTPVCTETVQDIFNRWEVAQWHRTCLLGSNPGFESGTSPGKTQSSGWVEMAGHVWAGFCWAEEVKKYKQFTDSTHTYILYIYTYIYWQYISWQGSICILDSSLQL